MLMDEAAVAVAAEVAAKVAGCRAAAERLRVVEQQMAAPAWLLTHVHGDTLRKTPRAEVVLSVYWLRLSPTTTSRGGGGRPSRVVLNPRPQGAVGRHHHRASLPDGVRGHAACSTQRTRPGCACRC